jgi:two-component system aerobic respiration control sensor histidine kinase ArcB
MSTLNKPPIIEKLFSLPKFLWSKLRDRHLRKQPSFGLETLIADAPCLIYWMNCQQIYLGCNKQLALVFEASSDRNIIGKKNTDFIADADTIKMLNQNNQQVINSNVLNIFEESFVLPSGKKMIFLSHKQPIFNTEGTVIGLMCVSTDITAQIAIQEQLKENEARVGTSFENIITHLPGNIWWLNKENIFLGCNEIQAKLAGLKSRHDIVGKTNYDMPWKEQADLLNEVNNQVMETGVEFSIEEKMQLNNNQEITVLSKKVPYRDKNGNIIGTMGIALDITDRKEMEKNLKIAMDAAEAANKAKTEFLEHIRHDIRTPLSGIMGLAELIQYEATSEKIQYYITQLTHSSRELLDFLNDMLESINIKSGQIPLMKKVFNLQSVLDKVTELHRAKAVDKNLSLELIYDPQIPPNLLGDPVRIYRIVLEMLGNALKFTEIGYVKVIAKLLKKAENDIVIQLEVEDSGPGVPFEKQQELFIRFKQVTPSYTGIYKGSGLGLSILKQFIDDLQAEVGYTDNPIGGARFICIVPFRQSLLDIPIELLPQHCIMPNN